MVEVDFSNLELRVFAAQEQAKLGEGPNTGRLGAPYGMEAAAKAIYLDGRDLYQHRPAPKSDTRCPHCGTVYVENAPTECDWCPGVRPLAVGSK